MKLNLQSIFCTLYYRSQRKCYFLLGFKKQTYEEIIIYLLSYCRCFVRLVFFVHVFFKNFTIHVKQGCCTSVASFLKGALSHFTHTPCYFPVPSSCSVFSVAFLLLAVWWLDQKAIFVPWVEDCCQEVQRLGVYAVKSLLHSLQQCSFSRLHAAICTLDSCSVNVWRNFRWLIRLEIF